MFIKPQKISIAENPFLISPKAITALQLTSYCFLPLPSFELIFFEVYTFLVQSQSSHFNVNL